MRRVIVELAAAVCPYRRTSSACLILVIATIVLGSGIADVSASVVITSWSMGINARDSVGDTARVDDDAVAMPFYAERTASTLGGTEGSVLYDFMTDGDNDSFHFEIDFYRSGSIDSQANSYADIHFQVTEESWFDFAGTFWLEGTGQIHVQARLRDLTIGGGWDGFIYYSSQLSENTADQVFHIDGLDGDLSNNRIGTLPGALLPGHEYLMQYSFSIITPVGGDAGANAHGLLDFSITSGNVPPSPIPEPSSVLTWLGLSGIGLLAAHRRRKQKRQETVGSLIISRDFAGIAALCWEELGSGGLMESQVFSIGETRYG